MILRREYLRYKSQLFMVTFEGEEARTAQQHLVIRVESATRGKPRVVKPIEVVSGTVEGSKPIVKDSLDREYGVGAWEHFPFTPGEDGSYAGGSLQLTAAIGQLIKECGLELARDELEQGREPEIVALCGGLECALKVFEHLKRTQ